MGAIQNKDFIKILDVMNKLKTAAAACQSKRRVFLMVGQSTCPCKDAIMKVMPHVQNWVMHAAHGDWDMATWMAQLPQMKEDFQTVAAGCLHRSLLTAS